MKKIVIVSSLQIFKPLSGGQLRTANLALSLGELGYDVLIYSLTGRKQEYLGFKKSGLTQINSGVSEFVNRNIIFGLIQRFFYIMNWPPLWIFWILKYYVPENLKTELADCDIVIADFPFLAPIFKHTNGQSWLNTHNAEYELWSNKPILEKIVKKIEIAAMTSAEKILFCSDNDRFKFLNLDSTLSQKSVVVANGVRPTKFFENINLRSEFRKSLGIDEKNKVFIFTASQFGPNVSAFHFLKKFCADYSNILIENQIIILIVGSVSKEKIDLPYLKVTGRVDEIATYICSADFGLNPVTDGSGVNVKMMEFLSALLPILSTVVGARGLSLDMDKDYISFTNENLINKLLLAAESDSETMNRMALIAKAKNQEQLDMKSSLKKILPHT